MPKNKNYKFMYKKCRDAVAKSGLPHGCTDADCIIVADSIDIYGDAKITVVLKKPFKQNFELIFRAYALRQFVGHDFGPKFDWVASDGINLEDCEQFKGRANQAISRLVDREKRRLR